MKEYTLMELVVDAKKVIDNALEEDFYAMSGETPLFAVAQKRMKKIQKMDRADFKQTFDMGKTKRNMVVALSCYGRLTVGYNNEDEFCDILGMVDRIGRRKKKPNALLIEDDQYYPKNLQDCFEELNAYFCGGRIIMDEDSEYVVVRR